jgi:3' terminal RNA ribose 2'-O-methyltransferase Hen1
MLFTLSTTTRAPDLSWLLHKNPDRPQAFELSHGSGTVFWSENSDARATVHLLIEIDPIGLVRGKVGSDADGPLAQYVNDRPYAASSLFSVALSKVFRSAMSGNAKDLTLVDRPRDLSASLSVVACRSGGLSLLQRLFEPLGYAVDATQLGRDTTVPAWGMSSLYSVTLTGTTTVKDLLRHLYVLIPVLDDDKHYWVGSDEVDKLVRQGEGWLEEHPAKEEIAQRYLVGQKSLARSALSQLTAVDEADEQGAHPAPDSSSREERLEKPLTLNEQRIERVVACLVDAGARKVADLGCGEGKLLRELMKNPRFETVMGLDVSPSVLEKAERKLKVQGRPREWQDRLVLTTGSAVYRDRRLDEMDAIALVEVIEHMELDRLPMLVASVFRDSKPALVVMTTPNADYNVLFEGLDAGAFRHADHRWEWSRATFAAWCQSICDDHGYTVQFESIGPVHPEHGAATQMARFARQVTA